MRNPSTPPSPPQAPERALASAGLPLMTGLRLLSGIGEDLGTIVGVESDRFGQPKWISFLEQGAAMPRRVRLDFIRGVTGDSVVLAGPREGYHITRVMRDPSED